MPTPPFSRAARGSKRKPRGSPGGSFTRRTAHARHSVELRDGGLRLVVVADTHGRPHPESGKHILAAKPDRILHAGDIGDLGVLDELERIAPVLAVRGNIDAPAREIPEWLTLDVLHGARRLIRVLMVHIGVAGTKLCSEVFELSQSEDAALVVCGHSHVPFLGKDRGLAIFNPGSIGPRRFQLPIVFGVIEVDREQIRMRHVSCETGDTWEP